MTPVATLARAGVPIRPVPPIRVLIVDDSAVARAALAAMIADAPSLAVAGQVENAERAVRWLASERADVVLLDLDMPGRGGLAALPDLIAAGQGARVLVVSAAAGRGAKATLEALGLGAADTLAKPSPAHMGRAFAVTLVTRIERLGLAERPTGATSPIGLRAPPNAPVDILAIGSSTGGIEALSAFLRALPSAFTPPILITQHLPPPFMPYLAQQLSAVSERCASVAIDGERVRDRHIFVAPGNAHLGVSGRAGYARIALTDAVSATRCCPSVDPMFTAIATFGAGAIGVVLSGMGCDGLAGARLIALAGGSLLAQDEASSAVWGMPGTIARAGLATAVGTPESLARHVGARASR